MLAYHVIKSLCFNFLSSLQWYLISREKISMFNCFVRFRGSLQVKLKERWVMKTSFTLYYQRRIKRQSLVLSTGNFRINMKLFSSSMKMFYFPPDYSIIEHMYFFFYEDDHLWIFFLLSGDYVSNVLSLRSHWFPPSMPILWLQLDNDFLLSCAFLVYWVGMGGEMLV